MTPVEQYQQFARTAKRLHTMAIGYRNWSADEACGAKARGRYRANYERLSRDAKGFLMRARWFKSACIERGEIQ